MAYSLRPGVTFCRTAGRLVFLDRVNDRYFGISDSSERAFDERRPDQAAAVRLAAAGLLVPMADSRSYPLAISHESPAASLLDERPLPPTGNAAILAAGRQLMARWTLKAFGFDRTLGRFERLRWEGRAAPRKEAQFAEIVSAHRSAIRLAATQDRCLPNSLALAHHLVAAGHPALLVLGVKLRPFEAHCWVELHDRIASDRGDVIRAFTPILVV